MCVSNYIYCTLTKGYYDKKIYVFLLQISTV